MGGRRSASRLGGALLIAAIGCLTAGCSQMGSASDLLSLAQKPSLAEAAAPPAAPDDRSELQKATEYWGKEYAKSPRDAQIALNYARNLKALGEKQQALAVLQQASMFHGSNRAVNAEYGRLALEFDQVHLAQKLLEQADDPANPDWKVISARGTALAKQGLYRDAIAFYERARTLAPDEPSILNNLALAHTMEGHAEKAEPLLRQAAAAKNHEARVNQNLALVLGLQGKHDEAKLAAAQTLPADNAAANVDYVRRIVALEPKPLATGTVAKTTPEAGQDATAAGRDDSKAKVAKAKSGAKPKGDTKEAKAESKGKPKLAAAEESSGDGGGWSTKVATTKSGR